MAALAITRTHRVEICREGKERPRRVLRSVLVISALMFCCCDQVFAVPYSFITIDYPGAVTTKAFGINEAGQIVGGFINVGDWHGYLLSGGSFTPIDVPRSDSTRAFAINAAGEIAGEFVDGTGRHGFRFSGGSAFELRRCLDLFIGGTAMTKQSYRLHRAPRAKRIVALVAALLVTGLFASHAQAELTPFTSDGSLGPMIDPIANVLFNTDAGTYTIGGVTHAGGVTQLIGANLDRTFKQGAEVEVYNFSSFVIQPGIVVSAIGTRPLIISSVSNITMGGTIDLSGGAGLAGNGGGTGGGGGGGTIGLFTNASLIHVTSTGLINLSGGTSAIGTTGGSAGAAGGAGGKAGAGGSAGASGGQVAGAGNGGGGSNGVAIGGGGGGGGGGGTVGGVPGKGGLGERVEVLELPLERMAPMRQVPQAVSAALAVPPRSDGTEAAAELAATFRAEAATLACRAASPAVLAAAVAERMARRPRALAAAVAVAPETERLPSRSMSRYRSETRAKSMGRPPFKAKPVMAPVAVEAVSSAARRTAPSRTTASSTSRADFPAIRKAASRKGATALLI